MVGKSRGGIWLFHSLSWLFGATTSRRIHVYMFTIDKLPNKKNGALNLKLKRHVFHKYRCSDFSLEGNKSVSFLGCFALPADGRKKRVEEANLYLHHFPYEESGEKDDDISSRITQKPPQKTKPSREEADSDSEVEMSWDCIYVLALRMLA